MKYIELHNLLLENKIDDLIAINPSLKDYEQLLKDVYRDIPISIKSHNKFGKFFDFIIKNVGELEEYKEKVEYIYKMVLKYNIDLSKYEQLKDVVKYIEDKEGIVNYVFDDNVKKIYEDDEKYVLRVWNFEGMKKYGSHFWCIAKEEKMWYEYILRSGKNPYLVLYKAGTVHYISGYDFRKASIQVNLDNHIYITDYENRASMGITETTALLILKEMNLSKHLFKSYLEDEDIKTFIDKNDNWYKYISRQDKEELKEILKKYGIRVEDSYDPDKFILAILENDINKVKRYVKNLRFDINYKNLTTRSTGLITAAKSDEYFEIFQLLLSREDISINSKNIFGNTAFLNAAKYGAAKIINELLKREDVDINATDTTGCNALFTNSPEVLKILLTETDIDVNVKNNDGKTAYEDGNDRKRRIFEQLNRMPTK